MISEDVLSSFRDKNCLVTGGTGLIGRQVVNILCGAGANVRTVSLDAKTVDERAVHLPGNLTYFSLCKEVTRGVDYVFHLAGMKGPVDATRTRPADFFVPMLMMDTSVLEACRVNNVEKVVYTSSIGAYASAEVFRESEGFEGQPMDPICWSKRMGEYQIQTYKVQDNLENFAVVRPANCYGPGDNYGPNSMVVASLIKRIYRKDDPVVVWGDGTAIRDFVFSRDVAEGIVLALHYGTKSAPFLNLGSGKGYSIKELIETLNSFIPFNYVYDTTKPSGFPKRVMDISLARELIHYNPTTSLLDGLKETWDWFVREKSEGH